jgi:ligand-binding sensor domain-containing protein
VRFGLIYTGTDDGYIYVTKDAGATFTLVSAPKKKGFSLPQDLWVSRVTASKFKEGRVYTSLNGYRNDDFTPYLFVSEDYGTTWTAIGKDLPAEPINVVKEDPKNENIIYVGTDGGLYVSFNKGQSFMMWNAGLPKSIPVHDIAIQERENEIVLGTHGRSIYIAQLEEVQKATQ